MPDFIRIDKVTLQGDDPSAFVNRVLVRFYNNHSYDTADIVAMRFMFSDGSYKQFGPTGRTHGSFEWGYIDKVSRGFDMNQLNDPNFPWDDLSHNFDYGKDHYGYKTHAINMPNGFNEMRIGRWGDPPYRSYIFNNNIGFYKDGAKIAELIYDTAKCCNKVAYPKDVYEAIDVDPSLNWTLTLKTPEGTVCGGVKLDDHIYCLGWTCQKADPVLYHERMFTELIGVAHTNKPQDGGWSAWSLWSNCSKPCGTGQSTRTRACDNPPTKYGGVDCVGDASESVNCNVWSCPPENAKLSDIIKLTSAQDDYDPKNKTTNRIIKYVGDSSNAYINKVRFKVVEHPRYTRAYVASIEFSFNDGSVQYLGVTDPKEKESFGYGKDTIDGGTSYKLTTHTVEMPDGFDEIKAGYIREARYQGYYFMSNIGFFKEGKELGKYVYPLGDCCQAPGLDYTNRSLNWQTEPKHKSSRSNTWSISLKVPNGYVISGLYENLYDNTAIMDWLENSHFFIQVEGIPYYPTPVNGGWGTWTSWTDCSKSCGGGTRQRTRECNNPFPQNGGADCVGETSESEKCNLTICPIDGGWTAWSAWTECSANCGGGTRKRTRKCSNPSPEGTGKYCDGVSVETEHCNDHECPVNGGWGEWGPWESCSKNCGGGIQVQRRSCNNPTPNSSGNPCVGDSLKKRVCGQKECPVDGGLGEWGPWGECIKDIDELNYKQKRTRLCDNPEPSNGGKTCEGQRTEFQECDPNVIVLRGESEGWGMVWFLFFIAIIAAAIYSFSGSPKKRGGAFVNQPHSLFVSYPSI